MCLGEIECLLVFLISSTTPKGALNHERKYVGKLPRTDVIIVSRPPKESLLDFHEDNLE